MATREDYRIKTVDTFRNTAYITRKNQRVSFFSGNLTPLCLSNLVGDKAAELQFKLEDATDGRTAVKYVREFLNGEQTATLL